MEIYKDKTSLNFYKQFLEWLFNTFDEKESIVRERMVEKLKLNGGERILVTGCGLGDDLPYILKAVGVKGEVHAQDYFN